TLRSPIPVVAVLVVPVAMVLDLVSRLTRGQEELPQAATALRSLHIVTATLGVAVFAVAAGISAVYLATERQLKRHHLGRVTRRGPALETLDTLGRRCILLGFPVFTLALITGAVFVARLVHSGSPWL